MSKAMKLLEEIMFGCIFSESSRKLGPGQIVLRLSQEKRDVLKELTSEEMQNMRPDSFWRK